MARADKKTKDTSDRASSETQMRVAAAQGSIEKKRDGARLVRYDEGCDEVQITLNSGVTMGIPRKRIRGL